MAHDKNGSKSAPPGAYTWPWWVLGAFLTAVLLAMLWMSREIARTRTIRELNAPMAQTNEPKAAAPAPR